MKYKEISKKTGDFTIWDDERIRRAHNFGKGNFKDFAEYMRNNSKYAKFEKIED